MARIRNLVNQSRGTGGPVKVPECDVAEMRYLRETEHKTYAEIVRHFNDHYSEKYVGDVCKYTIRSNIKPKKPED